MDARADCSYPGAPMHGIRLTNIDFLDWFTEEEREVCSDCGEKACVSFPGLPAAFCLACNAVKVDGTKIQLN
jgi:hypothetical protein